jgi:hypothetical protein
LECLLLEKINQPGMRIETDDARRVGDEIRERVDVVIKQRAVAIVDDVFNAAA